MSDQPLADYPRPGVLCEPCSTAVAVGNPPLAQRAPFLARIYHPAGRLMLVALLVFAGPVSAARAQSGGHPVVPVAVSDLAGAANQATASATGTSVSNTLRALDRLHSMGYTINTPARADRAIRSWQKSNGLTIDGIVGPQTLASLFSRAGTPAASAPAVDPFPPAPALGSDDLCAEMSAYRQAAGLPEAFDAIGFRESRCHNEVGNACCHGWWANYLTSHLSRGSAYRERIINECGVTQVSDIRGNSDAQKRASACVTFVVWSISGMSPWAL